MSADLSSQVKELKEHLETLLANAEKMSAVCETRLESDEEVLLREQLNRSIIKARRFIRKLEKASL